MTNTKSDGRRFERVVESIERLLDPSVPVEFDAKLPDRTTGDLRQFDILVRVPATHGPLLVAVECKDWSRPIDVAEIDAFVTKCGDCGISKAVIVSSNGFSEAARGKARFNKIDALVLEETGHVNWPNWMEPRSFEKKWLQWNVSRFVLVAESGLPITHSRATSPTAAGITDPSGQLVSVETVIDLGWLRPIYNEILKNAIASEQVHDVTVQTPGLSVVTRRGSTVRLAKVSASVRTWRTVENVALHFHSFREVGGKEVTSVFVSDVFEINGEQKIAVMSYDFKDGLLVPSIIVNSSG